MKTITTHAAESKFRWTISEENYSEAWIEERLDGAAISLMPYRELVGREFGETRENFYSAATEWRVRQQASQRSSAQYHEAMAELRANLVTK